jgi:hypothetical protein
MRFADLKTSCLVRSVVEFDIQAPRDKVAALFADPANNPKWMSDLERCEPIAGTPGMPGSTYRMVPKRGDMVFVATVLARNLPQEVKLRLDGKDVVVSITDRFRATSPGVTTILSEEHFRFKSLFRRVFGFVAQRSIRNAHRRHMESFKRFAEQQVRGGT